MRVRTMFFSGNLITGLTSLSWPSDNPRTSSNWTLYVFPLSITTSISMYCFKSNRSSIYLFISAYIPDTLIGSMIDCAIQTLRASILSSNDFIVVATISVSSWSNTIERQRILSIRRHELYNPTGAAKHQKHGNFFCLLGIATKWISSSN